MTPLNRRSFVMTGSAAAAAMALPKSARAQAGLLAFNVWRDDAIIGRHNLRFRQEGDELVVDIDIDLEVSLAFVTLYRYTHRNTERWRDGQLVSMRSRTNDNGTKHSVEVRRAGSELAVKGDEGLITVPGSAVPTTYWQPASIKRGLWLDSQRGKLLDLSVKPLGREQVRYENRDVACNRFGVRGDLNLDIWYGDVGWTKLQFDVWDGSVIRYDRRPESDVASLQPAVSA